MKWVVLLFFLPVLGFSQIDQGALVLSSPDLVTHYTKEYLSTDNSSIEYLQLFQEHISKLEDKRSSFKSDEAFLRFVFRKTHEKFLRNFTTNATFGEVFKRGDYNCLTATALYALLLQHFQFSYQVTETNYHIFLTAETNDGMLLFEGTDPQGFITDQKQIEKRIESYKENKINTSTVGNKGYYQLGCSLYKHVTLDEMIGLFHYNLAVNAFNHHQLDAAIVYLDNATAAYCSPRMEELTRILMLAVVESGLSAERKEMLVKRIQVFRKRNIMALASASAQ